MINLKIRTAMNISSFIILHFPSKIGNNRAIALYRIWFDLMGLTAETC